MVPNLCVPHSSTTLEVHHPPHSKEVGSVCPVLPGTTQQQTRTSWSGHRRYPARRHLSPGGQPGLTAVVPLPVIEGQVQVQVGAPSPPGSGLSALGCRCTSGSPPSRSGRGPGACALPPATSGSGRHIAIFILSRHSKFKSFSNPSMCLIVLPTSPKLVVFWYSGSYVPGRFIRPHASLRSVFGLVLFHATALGTVIVTHISVLQFLLKQCSSLSFYFRCTLCHTPMCNAPMCSPPAPPVLIMHTPSDSV